MGFYNIWIITSQKLLQNLCFLQNSSFLKCAWHFWVVKHYRDTVECIRHLEVNRFTVLKFLAKLSQGKLWFIYEANLSELIHFYSPWNYQKIHVFQMISEGIEAIKFAWIRSILQAQFGDDPIFWAASIDMKKNNSKVPADFCKSR